MRVLRGSCSVGKMGRAGQQENSWVLQDREASMQRAGKGGGSVFPQNGTLSAVYSRMSPGSMVVMLTVWRVLQCICWRGCSARVPCAWVSHC